MWVERTGHDASTLVVFLLAGIWCCIKEDAPTDVTLVTLESISMIIV